MLKLNVDHVWAIIGSSIDERNNSTKVLVAADNDIYAIIGLRRSQSSVSIGWPPKVLFRAFVTEMILDKRARN